MKTVDGLTNMILTEEVSLGEKVRKRERQNPNTRSNRVIEMFIIRCITHVDKLIM